MLRKLLNLVLIVSFITTTFLPIPTAQAMPGLLPEPGAMVSLSPAYQPTLIKGVTINKDNPFLFDFIVDVGQDKMEGDVLKAEGEKLIKYFLAGLAIPDKDLWVNLSPYEKDRTIPEALSQTEMGRDLLAQDYLLKQITASLIYPEKDLGKAFWDKVYAKAQAQFGTTDIPVNTFNKVWIMADKAEVFERNQTAFVTKAHLKVMLEEDYLAKTKSQKSESAPNISSQIIKEIVLPELEKEVNEGKNFAPLRQIYNSLILAGWYKNNLKEALLNQVYTDKSKVNGINTNDSQTNQQIYERYLTAYKKGVFNYIKDLDTPGVSRGTSHPRKYFSGGMTQLKISPAMTTNPASLPAIKGLIMVRTELAIPKQLHVAEPNTRYVFGTFFDDSKIFSDRLVKIPIAETDLIMLDESPSDISKNRRFWLNFEGKKLVFLGEDRTIAEKFFSYLAEKKITKTLPEAVIATAVTEFIESDKVFSNNRIPEGERDIREKALQIFVHSRSRVIDLKETEQKYGNVRAEIAVLRKFGLAKQIKPGEVILSRTPALAATLALGFTKIPKPLQPQTSSAAMSVVEVVQKILQNFFRLHGTTSAFDVPSYTVKATESKNLSVVIKGKEVLVNVPPQAVPGELVDAFRKSLEAHGENFANIKEPFKLLYDDLVIAFREEAILKAVTDFMKIYGPKTYAITAVNGAANKVRVDESKKTIDITFKLTLLPELVNDLQAKIKFPADLKADLSRNIFRSLENLERSLEGDTVKWNSAMTTVNPVEKKTRELMLQKSIQALNDLKPDVSVTGFEKSPEPFGYNVLVPVLNFDALNSTEAEINFNATYSDDGFRILPDESEQSQDKLFGLIVPIEVSAEIYAKEELTREEKQALLERHRLDIRKAALKVADLMGIDLKKLQEGTHDDGMVSYRQGFWITAVVAAIFGAMAIDNWEEENVAEIFVRDLESENAYLVKKSNLGTSHLAEQRYQFQQLLFKGELPLVQLPNGEIIKIRTQPKPKLYLENKNGSSEVQWMGEENGQKMLRSLQHKLVVSGRNLDEYILSTGQHMLVFKRKQGGDIYLLSNGAAQRLDKAMPAHVKGGIDLDLQRAAAVVKEGQGVEMTMDPALIEQIRREGLDGLVPVIHQITPLHSIWLKELAGV
jgi:hypothetical protein